MANILPVCLKSHRAMAQAVSRKPFSIEEGVQSQASPCGVCGEESGTGAGFPPSIYVLPCHHYSIGAPYLSFRHMTPTLHDLSQ
jgi:hypothetical protein